ncbi:uncharacterized protein LOC116180679 [Photinus pyralis]|uniref:HTH CENPB-type domain-containing protein n=1 Tax=Photinus pyralis TaxID=7054 RepID=A0A1Y1KC33_PHOPY|nr:uncharacterized protein LOC116178468 [Photinus pyralis]XP_031353827.1 uncharacterized protein LOC116178468 [Photinus pyralis]XP_031353828.1 uncharacterized protein LOC116178468 [Photinus pyralis]XP_031353829.1 uncharacterized protein LOC116178468 [Photinus pyralis]XP_031353830.1 uncharacterized protein LOC116178468 [Photinus pyralis]XP_031353831.1 uncharacterized protein LOC116178468 [Photinus pyralis]XP_031353832.1 uncharacterized protein LOC116178468 [Photinus pyralis]XP_031356650.1 unc
MGSEQQQKYNKYSEDQVMQALQDMEAGASLRATSKKHGIPRATLLRKSKTTGPLETKAGAPTVFDAKEEAILVKWVKAMANAGFPISKETLFFSVDKLATRMEKTFIGGKSRGSTMPGRKWYEGFMRRHPDIRERTSQNLTSARNKITQKDINQWFDEIGNYIQQNNLQSVFDDNRRIFNCDETAFFLNPKPGKVLAEKGSKNVYTSAGADEKFNLTVLVTGNAAGILAPPMIVYRYQRIPLQIVKNIPPEWGIGKSENGWMTQETFFEYITNIFNPWLDKHNIPRPVIMFLDGHSSHLSLPLSEFCEQKKIILVALYPNATHLIQPLDVAVFHTLKSSWKQKVAEWRIASEGAQMQKHNFPEVLQSVLGQLEPQVLISGFRKCGLVPWNPLEVEVPLNKPEEPKKLEKLNGDTNIVTFFTMLEQKLGTEKLRQFQSSNGTWNGATEDKSLYVLWLETKHTVEANKTPREHSPILTIKNSLDTKEETARDPEQEEQAVCEDKTPEKEAVAGPSKNSALVGVPTPFKSTLFWPQENQDISRKRKAEKLPSVVTSPQMIEYYKKKESMKRAKEEGIKKRKMEREEKKKLIEEKKKIAEEKKQLQNIVRSSSESSGNSSLVYQESVDSPWNESETSDEEIPEEISMRKLAIGDFILVNFVGGKRNSTNYKYVCVIQKIKTNEITVQGLQSNKSRKAYHLVDNDISSVEFRQIVGRLPQPEIEVEGRQVLYKFKKNICIMEKA